MSMHDAAARGARIGSELDLQGAHSLLQRPTTGGALPLNPQTEKALMRQSAKKHHFADVT